VSIQDGRAGVVITDPQAVPDQFVRIKREPDKTAIGAALASGNAVPGADMRNGAPSLTIRTK
jgi:phage host-nuclease inhibitor protein Gam